MKAIFVDTSFLLALPFENDAMNERARAWKKALRGPFVTSDFVLLEVADALSDSSIRETAQEIISYVRADQSMTVVPLDIHWQNLGYQRFCKHRDKDWGLTDCIAFEIMKEYGITDALTHDHHFEQAGFRALLRHEPPTN